MSPKTTKRQKARRDLACYACGGDQLELDVNRGQRRKKVGGVQRTVVHVSCRTCKHEWWSRHDTALAIAKRADVAAKGEAA